MAKKSKSAETNQRRKQSDNRIDPATRHGIISIGLFALAMILFFSLFGWAGTVGQWLDAILAAVVGLGRYALPVFLLIVVYNLLYPREEAELSPLFSVGLAAMALSVFGLIDVLRPQAGGYIGVALTYIFRQFASVGVAVVVLAALLLISVLVVFNTSLQHLVGNIPARTVLGKSLRFVVALFGSARQRIAIAKEQAMESVSEEPAEELLEEDALIAEEEEEFEPTSAFAGRSLADDAAVSTRKPRQLKLVRVPQSHRKIDLPLDLLSGNRGKPTSGDVEHNKEIIVKTFHNFGIDLELGPVSIGPTVTQYSFRPASGVKLSQIVSLQNDIALALAAHPIRIEAPIPGKSLVGIEVPNVKAAQVGLRELFESEEFKQRKSNLTLAFGRDVSGKSFTGDIGNMPHMLIAGATGSGKSVCMNTVLISLLYQNGPDDLKIILVDPKRVEFTMYNEIPHLLTPVITDVQKTINALQWTVNEMDRRYEVLAHAKRRDIGGYNTANPDSTMPYIVFVIDELADLMATAPREVEAAIVRLAQMARAVGIHLVLATQRPSVDVITGLIKANITTRCAFATASLVDSRTIIDMSGAEKLLGRGDMLYMSTDSPKPRRLQGAYVSEEEVNHVVTYLKEKAKPEYDTEVVERQASSALPQAFTDGDQDDELLPAAKKIIIDSQKASASLLQRRLRVGYARAARLLDILEEQGFIGPADGAKPREILAGAEALLASLPSDRDIPLPTSDEDETADESEEESEESVDQHDTNRV
ncbi:MAG: DNA translocase FtsK 4TM domain-containing protein [Candidatus Kerfeldbacteria bacterium]|nr:DNA translocase FtsK 4TM domain-containing protein [Candidatus Kerfeldbacteria bacterium]